MPLFITFEGPEGSGKSTQVRALHAALQRAGVSAILTREPGGTHLGEHVRDVLLDLGNTDIRPVTEALLYFASRAQLVNEVIKPALAAEKSVICDRFADSTFAYQGFGNGLDLTSLRLINGFTTGGLNPDLTFYLDLPVEIGLERKRSTNTEWTRIEARNVDFHQRVRAGYLDLANAEPERWVVIDAALPVDDIKHIVLKKAFEKMGIKEPRDVDFGLRRIK